MSHTIHRTFVLAAISIALSLAACSAGPESTGGPTIARVVTDRDGTTSSAPIAPEQHADSAGESTGQAKEALSSASFTRTCYDWELDFYTDGEIGVPYATCRRRNGTWQSTSWGPGYCSGDLSNCNGHLQCGGACP